MSGSPPRGRGKGVDRKIALLRYGITPAWAGKRLSPVTPYNPPSDHPRMGGEKPFLFYGGSSDSGSPPHGRGKGLGLAVNVLGDGITPAWAGKRLPPCRAGGTCRDHPRVGGEKSLSASSVWSRTGSPPRWRGKVGHSVISAISSGITPAWAGKRRRVLVKLAASRDHPRVGGEKVWRTSSGTCSRGSPPRGRGKVRQVRSFPVSSRITPAWAGKRLRRGKGAQPL